MKISQSEAGYVIHTAGLAIGPFYHSLSSIVVESTSVAALIVVFY